MNAAEVIIHFIGLVLFSSEVTNDPGLHAILPGIHHTVANPTLRHEHRMHTVSTSPRTKVSSTTSTSLSGDSANIEPHMALLIFPSGIRDQTKSDWMAAPLPSVIPALAGYEYVPLEGEHITFIADAPGNGAAQMPANMPKLPRANRGALKPEYQWPYARAAAVVDIPEGTLEMCKPPETVASGRIDTQLILQTTGKLTIVAVKAGAVKTLVIDTSRSPRIYVANVPPPRLQGAPTTVSDLHLRDPHHYAYFRMIGENPPSGKRGIPVVETGAPPVCACRQEPAFHVTGPGSGSDPTNPASTERRLMASRQEIKEPPQPPSLLGVVVANAECSNTQWP